MTEEKCADSTADSNPISYLILQIAPAWLAEVSQPILFLNRFPVRLVSAVLFRLVVLKKEGAGKVANTYKCLRDLSPCFAAAEREARLHRINLHKTKQFFNEYPSRPLTTLGFPQTSQGLPRYRLRPVPLPRYPYRHVLVFLPEA